MGACKIIPNIKKLNLFLDSDNMSECYRYLGCLHKLESLCLSPIGETSELRNKLTLPISLNKSVEGCALEPEDLWMIGSLPQLQVLELKSISLDDQLSFIKGQFLRLKFLKLTILRLTYLPYADSSHFPVLEKLFLVSLDMLEEIPSSIGEIPTLEIIHVEFCSHSAAISAIRIKEDELENQGNDALQVQVTILGSKLESFLELVERERLTIDNIHLETLGWMLERLMKLVEREGSRFGEMDKIETWMLLQYSPSNKFHNSKKI